MASTISAGTTTTTALVYSADTSGVLQLQTNGGTTAITIDTNQNVGLGVTPSAWYSTSKALELGNYAAISGSATTGYANISNNAYQSNGSGWAYKITDKAALYSITNGSHAWYNAPSGTAGNAITFTQAMTLDISGNLLVGTTNTNATVPGNVISGVNGSATNVPFIQCSAALSTNAYASYILYSTTASAYRFYVDYSGTIHATTITITAMSDQRLKENVRDIDTGLDAIMALKPRRFDWKEGKGQDKKNAAGFIAQEFEEVFPECVSTSKAGGDGIEYKNINHETLIPTLVKAVQELSAQVTTLQTQVTALKG